MPAEKAGMKLGDEIVSVDGQPIAGLEAMIESLKRTQDKPIQITVRRNGQLLDFTVQPVLSDVRGDQRYRVGIGSAPMKVSSLPFAAAFRRSVEQNKQGSLLILELVQKMIQRKISIRSIEGPIGIGRAAGQAASKKGWTPLLELTAGISLNLGIFNLLPIPIMDGGVILLLFVESLIRRDISLQDQRTHLPGGICLPGIVRGHGDLQRRPENAAQHDGENALTTAVSCQLSASSSWLLASR